MPATIYSCWLPSSRKDEKQFISLVDLEALDQQWEQAGKPGGQLAPCCMVVKESDRFGAVVPAQVSLTEVWNNDNFHKSRAVFADETIE